MAGDTLHAVPLCLCAIYCTSPALLAQLSSRKECCALLSVTIPTEKVHSMLSRGELLLILCPLVKEEKSILTI